MNNPLFPDRLDENNVPVIDTDEIVEISLNYAQARANLEADPKEAAKLFLKSYSEFYQELSKDEAEETLDDEMLE